MCLLRSWDPIDSKACMTISKNTHGPPCSAAKAAACRIGPQAALQACPHAGIHPPCPPLVVPYSIPGPSVGANHLKPGFRISEGRRAHVGCMLSDSQARGHLPGARLAASEIFGWRPHGGFQPRAFGDLVKSGSKDLLDAAAFGAGVQGRVPETPSSA